MERGGTEGIPRHVYRGPGRLGAFLSEVLGEAVRVKSVLPNDTTRLTDERSLLVLDIVVEFEDGRIANKQRDLPEFPRPCSFFATMSSDEFNNRHRNVQTSEIFVSCDYC